jgi:hypothetical protein
METPPTLDVPPQAASSAPRRARRKTYPLSLGVSLVLHVSLALVAWAHHPFAVMAGGVEASRGTFTVAIAPKRGAAFREAANARHEFAPEEPVEDLGVVEDSLVLPEPEVVPVEVPETIARPEQPLLGGAPAPDVDWESHPWNFRAPPQEAVPSRASGGDVAGKQGTDAGEAAAAGATGAVVVAGPVGPVGSELTSSTHGGNAVSPGVEGGNGPVLIRERSKDPEYPQRCPWRCPGCRTSRPRSGRSGPPAHRAAR